MAATVLQCRIPVEAMQETAEVPVVLPILEQVEQVATQVTAEMDGLH
jgi:hypothetical protein